MTTIRLALLFLLAVAGPARALGVPQDAAALDLSAAAAPPVIATEPVVVRTPPAVAGVTMVPGAGHHLVPTLTPETGAAPTAADVIQLVGEAQQAAHDKSLDLLLWASIVAGLLKFVIDGLGHVTGLTDRGKLLVPYALTALSSIAGMLSYFALGNTFTDSVIAAGAPLGALLVNELGKGLRALAVKLRLMAPKGSTAMVLLFAGFALSACAATTNPSAVTIASSAAIVTVQTVDDGIAAFAKMAPDLARSTKAQAIDKCHALTTKADYAACTAPIEAPLVNADKAIKAYQQVLAAGGDALSANVLGLGLDVVRAIGVFGIKVVQ